MGRGRGSHAVKGNALLQVIVIGVIMGAMMGVISRVTSGSKAMSRRVRDTQALALLKNYGSSIHQDLGVWVNEMRKADTTNTLANCLSLTTTFTCPTNAATMNTTVTDRWVTQRASQTGWTNRRVYGVSLWDANGMLIAGPETNPYRYNAGGLATMAGVTTATSRRFEAVGYMIAERNTGDPGRILFVRKLTLTSVASTSLNGQNAVKPQYEEIEVDLEWKNPGGRGLPVGSIVPYVGTTPPGTACPPPNNQPYLYANGCASVSRIFYPQLCAAMGVTTGATCALPDLRGMFLRGAATALATPPAVVAAQGGLANLTNVGTVTPTSDVAPHEHGFSLTLAGGSATGSASIPSFNISAVFAGGWGVGYGSGNAQDCPASNPTPCGGSILVTPTAAPQYTYQAVGSASVPLSVTSASPSTGTFTTAVGGSGPETRPPTFPINYVIRADY